MNDRLRVFISSRMEELALERQEIKTILDEMHIDAWVFEQDAGARASSIQQTFLEEVEKADIYIGLFWKGYGSYTIQEFEHARKLGKDCLIFEKRSDLQDRDPRLQAFLDSISQVESGLTIQWFETPAELDNDVTRAILYRLTQTYRQTVPLSSQSQAVLYTKPGKVNKPEKLIGRKKISDQVDKFLDQKRHVLLFGMGGTGKTALALSIADQRLAMGKGSFIWLQPNRWDDGETILDALVAPVASDQEKQSVTQSTGDAKSERVSELLEQSQVGLIVLDDIWDGNALRTVMDAIPKTMPVLVTSRQKYPKFDRVEIGELSTAEAVKLLSHYAVRDFPDQAAAKRLCQELGNHPYALEIAGATLDVDDLQPNELLEQIKGQVHDLPMPEDFAEEGRESVKKLLDRSYLSLDSDLQDAFSAFGALFAPGGTSALIAELMQLDPQKCDRLLKILVRRSLARRRPDTDFYEVHALTFSYANMLARQEGRDHQKLIGAVLPYLQKYGQDFVQVELDHANILGAAAQSDIESKTEIICILALGGYQEQRGFPPDYLKVFDEVLRHLGKLLDQGQLEPQAQKTYRSLLGKRGNAYFHHGQYGRAAEAFKSALELSDEEVVILKLCGILGRVLSYNDQQDQAQPYYERGYRLAAQLERDDLTCWVLQQESWAAGHLKDYERVQQISEQQVEVYERILQEQDDPGIKTQLFYALLNWGSAKMDMALRDLPEGERRPVIQDAKSIHERAKRIAAELENEVMLAEINSAIGEDYHNLGDRTLALEHFLKGLEIWKEKERDKDAQKDLNFLIKHGYAI